MRPPVELIYCPKSLPVVNVCPESGELYMPKLIEVTADFAIGNWK